MGTHEKQKLQEASKGTLKKQKQQETQNHWNQRLLHWPLKISALVVTSMSAVVCW